ncbi:sensor domain-containing diguanylate cyclase [Deinococcus hohokamensis]|uniref:Diguanylate cyclase domain-containing protein n=1 Tax=Deinococcus hohokamensis TaxID=309883 RepID=A0ABV9I8X9_9DEIO
MLRPTPHNQTRAVGYGELLDRLALCGSEEQRHAELARAIEQGGLPLRLTSTGDLEWTGQGSAPEVVRTFQAGVRHLAASGQSLSRAAVVAACARELVGQGELTEVWKRTLQTVRTLFGLRGVTVLQVTRGQLRAQPAWSVGDLGGAACSADDLQAVREGQPVIREAGLLLPLAGQFRARLALWLNAPGRLWPEQDQLLLRQLAQVMALDHERIQAQRHLSSLMALHRDIMSLEPAEAYRPLLERAVEVIPGAESGSLLLCAGEIFRYAAAVTHDETDLQDVEFDFDDVCGRWYGLDEAAWREGVPRILSGQALRDRGTGYTRNGSREVRPLPSLGTITTHIGVPVIHAGEVYAFLNIESHSDPEAFGDDSLAMARSFAAQAALLLHEANQRARIQQAARTDSLTGLLNRRAFTEELRRQVAHARRHHEPLTLLLADIRHFKQVNDLYGHAAGDEALNQVAELLCATVRAENAVFRWGGDEFAVLLPGTPRSGAEALAGRVEAALTGHAVGRLHLQLNMGVASLAPQDENGEALLQDADAAMYRQKHNA